MKSIEVFTGFSELGVAEALQNALNDAGNPVYFEIIELLGSHDHKAHRQYQVSLKILPKQ